MNTIQRNTDLIELLNGIKGATIVGLTTKTEVRMRKTGNPLAGAKVEKLTTKTCQFGYSYENAVNNRLDKVGVTEDFKAESLAWGEWLIPNKVIAHKGKYYGRFYTMANAESTTIYFVNGKVANPRELEAIEKFAYGSSESQRQTEAGLLTENQVKPMNYEFGSILSIRVGGESYEVKIAKELEDVPA